MNNILKFSAFLGTALLLSSCAYFEEEVPKEAIARVNDTYLYRDDIAGLVSENISDSDSVLIVSNFIKNWATKQVLLDRAKLNLPKETQKKFESLVKDYRQKLYIKAYKDALVAKNLDTAFTDNEIESFYIQNKEMFNLNENLIKLRYIHVSDSLSDFNEVKQQFIRFDKEDIKKLMDKALQFNSYSFNDSVWVNEIKVYEQIKALNSENNSGLLKKSNFMQLEDSLGVYLIFVNDVLPRHEQAPLSYVKPTIEQILLHKRKLELAKKLEQEIKNDAFKNNQIEIYP
ncbi:MAG TPA: peptidyl-prolyl cis-trans isomerase [Flavobacteriaceae bacterium]|nr:peptidyl-prolyl cis-trans isomerase [Flavobacteriaceae bacterium]